MTCSAAAPSVAALANEGDEALLKGWLATLKGVSTTTSLYTLHLCPEGATSRITRWFKPIRKDNTFGLLPCTNSQNQNQDMVTAASVTSCLT